MIYIYNNNNNILYIYNYIYRIPPLGGLPNYVTKWGDPRRTASSRVLNGLVADH